MHILVAGLGRFGRNLAVALTRLGHDVVAIDMSQRAVQDIAPDIEAAVTGDATDEDVLREIGAPDVQLAIVAMADVEASVLITTNLKNLNVPLVYAKASSDVHGTILERVGADRVIFPEQEMAVRLAQTVETARAMDYFELLPHLGIAQIPVGATFAGRTLASMDLRGRHNATVLAIKRGNELVVMPELTDRVMADDVLVVVGRDEQLARIVAASAGD